MDIYGNRIFTNRLLLRKIEPEDLSLLVQWSFNVAAYGDFLTPEMVNPEELQQQLESGVLWHGTEKLFIVELREAQPIGTLHYWQAPGRKKTAMISLKIAVPTERNKGYGTEMQKFLIMHLFNHEAMESIEMYTDINNLPQQRCLGKLGFELVESLVYDDQHEKRTGHLYRLTRERYSNESIYRYHYE